MPQPLSKLLKRDSEWSIQFEPEVLQKQQEMAAKIAEIIARASAFDQALSQVLVQVLHASPEPAFAMYGEVMDARNRRAMILAAAKCALSAEDFEILEVASAVIKSQVDIRNKFAHWLWGACKQIPDGLLLVDPRYLLNHSRTYQQAHLDLEETGFSPEKHEHFMEAMRFDFEKIYVYRDADFDEILRDYKEAQLIIGNLVFILSPQARMLDERMLSFSTSYKSQIPIARSKIHQQRLFDQALARMRKKRQKQGDG